MTSRPEENFYGIYDYNMRNLGISLLFPEIEGYGLRYQSLNLSRIVMVNSDSVDDFIIGEINIDLIILRAITQLVGF
jgi:hypothetical protein